ncbi:MAG: mismatch repair protein MutS [Verrucomicrobiales bacterium]|nr:mismatch repair protein MutS [Verrucomicrobiales bacterium]
MNETFPDSNEPVEYPIDGVLDLHGFKPKEVKDLVQHYLLECQKRGILRVRVIHGKGIGNLRRTVHALLAKMPEVISYSQASAEFGHWGATIVELRGRESAQS